MSLPVRPSTELIAYHINSAGQRRRLSFGLLLGEGWTGISGRAISSQEWKDGARASITKARELRLEKGTQT